MYFNPFIDEFPVESSDEWIGNRSIIAELEHCVKHRANTCILGPEGSGKTSLLNTTFSPEYRKKMAKTKKKLIYFADLSTRKDGDDLCEYLADRLFWSLDSLIQEREELATIKEMLKQSETESGKTRFQNMIQKLHEDWGYFIVIVMDYFELFTLSPFVTQEHHDCLRSLIESGSIQCIVATNYDLTYDSLPSVMRGSFFLQKFTNVIKMRPFTFEDVEEYLKVRQEDCDLVIPENMTAHIFKLSGGIPKLVNILAKQIYENLLANNGIVNVGEAMKAARSKCEPILDGWCKLLSDAQLDAIKKLTDMCSSNQQYGYYDFTAESNEVAVAALESRNLFQRYSYVDQNGNLIFPGDYVMRFNSLLFQHYCKEMKMTEAAKRNPLRRTGEKKNEGGQTVINTYNYGTIYENGAANNSQSVNVQTMQIVQGITPKEFLQMLSGSDSQEELGMLISGRLQKHIQEKFNRREIQTAIEQPYMDIAAHDDLVDQAFVRAGQQLFQDVQIDEYDDITDVTTAELQTLEDRFTAARDKIHQDLTDEILERQSERCQFYLKMAVVVEEALTLPGIDFGDYSAQLILYGKVVEQALRDNLFNLFHGEAELSTYSLGGKNKNPVAKDNFGHMNVARSFIGSFAHLMEDKNDYLADLCANVSFDQYKGDIPSDWAAWWRNLAADIHHAREIRNLAGHAGSESPEREKMEEMYGLLFGSAAAPGILERILAGKDLSFHYFVPAITRAEADRMMGQICEMYCTKQKSNGGIRGKLKGTGYEVNISPRKVNRYQESAPVTYSTMENHTFMVKIMELKHDSGKDFFVAEIESEKNIQNG